MPTPQRYQVENRMCRNQENSQHDCSHKRLEKSSNTEPVVLVVLVEVIIVKHKVVPERPLIENNHVGDQRWLERIIQVRNQPEIVDGHERYQLQILNKNPEGEEVHISSQQHG